MALIKRKTAFCRLISRWMNRLRFQLHEEHEVGSQYECNECTYKTCFKQNLKRHKHAKHPTPVATAPAQAVVLMCHHCGTELKSKYGLCCHVRSKHEDTDMSHISEFFLGGVAACGAGFFTNPLEVVKTRMQLQGELQHKGAYTVHYRNSFHAFYTIGRTDGILALQNGLVPALWYQLFMNGVRLGSYQMFINLGLTRDKNGNMSWPRSVLAGAVAGASGAAVASPLYMVKTHLQNRAQASIAVGTQHSHDSMVQGLRLIYGEHGILGLWRGVSAAVTRVMIGSAAQLSTFSTAKEYIIGLRVFHKDSWLNALFASIMGGCVVVACMTPFDVVSTRMYNQPVSSVGKGLLYSNILDCFVKIFKNEGLWGFYKGWGPQFLRLCPHTILSLVFWDSLRKMVLT